MAITCSAGCAGSKPGVKPDRLHEQAVRESLVPIRPGELGKRPFWNGYARQFIYAPAFDFQEAVGAQSYRYSVCGEDGVAHTFDAPTPHEALTPVWKDVPVGGTMLTVEAIDMYGQMPPRMVGTRAFHRAAVFDGVGSAPAISYAQSARRALASVIHEPFVQHWRVDGKPDPSYAHYRYASKIIGSLISGCALYATQTPRPSDADDAIDIGRRAADFLMSVSGAPGSPLEYFPPTYHNATTTDRENDAYTMLISPAEAGQGYLDLYDVTHDAKYLDATIRIASTYGKLQHQSGTWFLKVNNQTGAPLEPNELIPTAVIDLLDRLVHQYGRSEFEPMLNGAIAWVMNHPARTFDWSAQFDDGKQRGPYENLSKHEACTFASYLFTHSNSDPAKGALARDLLRFSEDQFVIWSHPPALKTRVEALEAKHWIVPCSTEQYAMFEPVSGSSAFMIVAYVRAHQASHDPLDLAKAKALANALIIAQSKQPDGRYPTRMIDQDMQYWINSTINTARAMLLLDKELSP